METQKIDNKYLLEEQLKTLKLFLEREFINPSHSSIIRKYVLPVFLKSKIKPLQTFL